MSKLVLATLGTRAEVCLTVKDVQPSFLISFLTSFLTNPGSA